MKKINEAPFELVGFKSEDYFTWCKNHKKRKNDAKSKREFFKAIYDFKIIKKDGQMVDLTEGE